MLGGVGDVLVEVLLPVWSALTDPTQRIYWLYLVANIFTSPRIHPIQDPFGAHQAGEIDLTPVTFRVEWRDRSDD